jgi:hypothetical protein
MTGFIYAARIGDFIKVGYTWHPTQRVINLRSEFRCLVELIGVVEGFEATERNFHSANRHFAVSGEIYPADAPPVIEFMKAVTPYISGRSTCGPRGPMKWTESLPAGTVPVSRHQILRELRNDLPASDTGVAA